MPKRSASTSIVPLLQMLLLCKMDSVVIVAVVNSECLNIRTSLQAGIVRVQVVVVD